MKYSPLTDKPAGFTLVELMVSMAITVVLLGALVYLTGISMDTLRDTRDDVRASRQAKEALEMLAKDFESMVARRDGNTHEWLYAGPDPAHETPQAGPQSRPGGKSGEILNASQLVFFTGATDRYNGAIGSDTDNGGDVSAVSYRLVFRDHIGNTDNSEFAVFSLYRHLANPDEAFELLATTALDTASDSLFNNDDDVAPENFVAENIYEFTVTFLVEVASSVPGQSRIERVTLRQNSAGAYTEFRLKGNQIEVAGPAPANVADGNIVGVEISITVLSEQGLTLVKKSGMDREELVKKHGSHFTKTISTPRP